MTDIIINFLLMVLATFVAFFLTLPMTHIAVELGKMEEKINEIAKEND